MNRGERTSSWFRMVACVLLFALAVSLNMRLERTEGRGAVRHSFYMPSGEYVRYASFGFHHLVADFLYIWSIQYFSVERTDRWRYLSRLYDIITDLDPHFVTAFSVGALILSREAGRTDQALLLLDKGIELNPDTYALAWEAGFYAKEIGSLDRTKEYFAVAKDKPDAPRYVARWYMYTVNKAGDTDAALELWSEALETARDDYERRVAERHIAKLLSTLQLQALRERVQMFRERSGRLPLSLQELVKVGLLTSLPVDGEGEPFLYDRKTGDVSSSGSFFDRR